MDALLGTETVLHNGITIPSLGYSTDGLTTAKNAYDNVLSALRSGFRSIDTSAADGFEKEVGKAIRDSGLNRSDLFLSDKLANADHGYEAALRAAEVSLKRLNTDYLNLYLVQWPNPKEYRSRYEEVSRETWKAMETIYKNGNASAIGICNAQPRHIEQLLANTEIAPMVNQLYLYPGAGNADALAASQEHGILCQAVLPPDAKALLSSRELNIFSEKYSRSPMQICARYALQKSCIMLTSGDPAQAAMALNAFTFTLAKEDLAYLDHMHCYGSPDLSEAE